ncbi:MAG: hypothetical protein J6R77_00470, partial [Clostridia bacterium]|nr:hypothetical protein [Clostridia bacterium]
AVACTDWSEVTEGRAVAAGRLSEEDGAALRAFAESGHKVILLGQGALPETLLDGAVFQPHRQEIVTMNIPESTVFSGIDPMDPAWFGDERRVPYAALGRYTVDRFSADNCVLAETLEWHGYINHPTDYKKFGGTPLFARKVGKGHILVSALRTDAADFDPVASRLTANILNWDFDLA